MKLFFKYLLEKFKFKCNKNSQLTEILKLIDLEKNKILINNEFSSYGKKTWSLQAI